MRHSPTSCDQSSNDRTRGTSKVHDNEGPCDLEDPADLDIILHHTHLSVRVSFDYLRLDGMATLLDLLLGRINHTLARK